MFSGTKAPSKEKRLIAGVEAYWEALRPFADIPARAQIDPRGLEAALDYTFVLERQTSGEARFRVAGHRISDLIGLESDRLPFAALFAPDCQAQARQAIDAMFQQPAILRGELSAPRSSGRPSLLGHLSVLPLRHDDGSITRALGVLVTLGQIGRAPRHFEELTHNLTRLVLADPAVQVEPDYGMAEPQSPLIQTKEKGRPEISERPKFRVIQGSKL